MSNYDPDPANIDPQLEAERHDEWRAEIEGRPSPDQIRAMQQGGQITMIYVLTLINPTLPTDVQIMRVDRDTAQLVEAAASESGYYTADARTYAGDHCLLLIPYAGTDENISAIVKNLNRIVNTYGKTLDGDGSRITVPLQESE